MHTNEEKLYFLKILLIKRIFYDTIYLLTFHLKELYEILYKYNISDKINFIALAETDLVFQRAILMRKP
jgi:hypothetical protein